MGTLPIPFSPTETGAIDAEIRDGSFQAVLALEANGKRVGIDARWCDGIALALRAGAPSPVQAANFDAAGAARARSDRRQLADWRTPRGRAPATRCVEL